MGTVKNVDWLRTLARRAFSALALVGTAGCSDGGSIEVGESPTEPVAESSEALTVQELFPTSGPNGSLDGRLLTIPCGDDNPAGTDCASGGAWYQAVRTACSGGRLNVVHTYPVAG